MNNIRKARETSNFSQKQVAIELKVSPPTVSEWESGKKFPSGKRLTKLSELFGVTTDYLLGRTDELSQSSLDSEIVLPDGFVHAWGGDYKELDDEDMKVLKGMADYMLEQKRLRVQANLNKDG